MDTQDTLRTLIIGFFLVIVICTMATCEIKTKKYYTENNYEQVQLKGTTSTCWKKIKE